MLLLGGQQLLILMLCSSIYRRSSSDRRVVNVVLLLLLLLRWCAVPNPNPNPNPATVSSIIAAVVEVGLPLTYTSVPAVRVASVKALLLLLLLRVMFCVLLCSLVFLVKRVPVWGLRSRVRVTSRQQTDFISRSHPVSPLVFVYESVRFVPVNESTRI